VVLLGSELYLNYRNRLKIICLSFLVLVSIFDLKFKENLNRGACRIKWNRILFIRWVIFLNFFLNRSLVKKFFWIIWIKLVNCKMFAVFYILLASNYLFEIGKRLISILKLLLLSYVTCIQTVYFIKIKFFLFSLVKLIKEMKCFHSKIYF
jgi:hypothetical protein